MVVAPRILLAEQLAEFLEHVDAHVMHVHSGETDHFSTTKAKTVKAWSDNVDGNRLIFTTYNSLRRIEESGINVDTIYFDETTTVSKKFILLQSTSVLLLNVATFYCDSETLCCCIETRMNNYKTYGNIICNVPAPKLVDEGYILPPKVVVNQLIQGDFKMSDCDNLISTIDDNSLDKILIAARSTRQIVKLFLISSLRSAVEDTLACISRKTGAFIDGVKVDREEFFKTLNAWGRDPEKKLSCTTASFPKAST